MEERSKIEIICDAVCGLIMLGCVGVYVLIGFIKSVWHPTWVIIVAGAIVCGIISIISNTVVNFKKINKKSEDEDATKIEKSE